MIGVLAFRLKKVQGAEKLFANMLAWGEYDIHAGNIGVMKVKDAAGKSDWVFAKIDHGWSATKFFTDPGKALEYFASAYKYYGYQGKVPLDINKFKQSLDQITTISDDEIERIVKSRIYELKKMGFDPTGSTFMYNQNSMVRFHDSKGYKSFDDIDSLEEHYINRFQMQIKAMRKLSKRLEIVSRIDYSSSKSIQKAWQNGGWLQDIKGMDPIEWAKENGKTIVESKDSRTGLTL